MRIISYLSEEIANILGISAETVINNAFDDLGLTSVNMSEIVEKLSLNFPQLPITILYEYKNLEELADYLQQNYPNVFAEKYQESTHQLTQDDTLLSQNEKMDIAIIGMAGYFPGAINLDEFWKLLLDGESAFGEVPVERWDANEFYCPDETKSGSSYTKWGAFLKDVDKFDPLLFNISPRDAAKIDPQERLFLQASYTALEDSGHIELINNSDSTSVGVYVGVTNASYGWLENDHAQWRQIKHVNVSSAYWSVANRVSYTFNFSGPSLSIDTACSSSLTALHLACESLKRGECSYCIVGGVNLILHPRQYTELSEMKMLSRGNQNKTFSDTADGFVYGEGIISLVLKPLYKALEDHDRIYALIKSTSVNASGKTSGYTVPSPNAQAALIANAIEKSGYTSSDIQYIECHGTGTKLGDPIEIRGLAKAFELTASQKQYCLLGSVKTNIGHLESAAGLAGVVKVALQIANKRIAPSILVEPLNKKIDFDKTPFKLAREVQPWPNENTALLGCISSFGAGGSNAHAILSNHSVSPNNRHPKQRGPYVLGISANHPTTLRQKLEDMYTWLQSSNDDFYLGDMVYTLNNHRVHYSHRMAFIFNDIESLKKQCLDVIVNEIPLNYYSNSLLSHISNNQFSNEILHQIAVAYVNGQQIDWQSLYKKEDYQVIKLPMYPFLKERCWITDEFKNQIVPHSVIEYPFISKFDMEQKSCLNRFSGQHYAFDEHVLRGEKIFPGVCHLEMVHEAYTAIYQAEVGAISEITWLLPINLVDDCCEVKLQFIENEDNISYQLGKLVDGQFLLCSQGKISPDKKELTQLDILSYKVNLMEEMTGEELYTFFREKGWYHGPAFQSVNHLYIDDEMLVAEIELPIFFNGHDKQYGLNPGMMDGILQAITILNRRISTSNAIALPFYLQSLDIIKPLPEKMNVLVTVVEGRKRSKNKQFNVIVTNLDGSICLTLSGFTMALIQEQPNHNDIHYYTYEYRPAMMFDEQTTVITSYSRILIVANQTDSADYIHPTDIVLILQEKRLRISGSDESFDMGDNAACLALIHKLKDYGTAYHLINLVDLASSVYGRLNQFVHLYISFIQRLLKEHLPLKFIFSCELTSPKLGSLGACMPGFYKSLHTEMPGISACHLVIDESYQNTQILKEKLSTVIDQHYHCPELHLTSHGFNYLQLAPVKFSEAKFTFKPGAVYLIAGGLGGLGRVLTTYITQEYGANVILLGRSAIDEEKLHFLDTCNRTKKLAYYYQVDTCNESDLSDHYQRIKLDFPEINGVFNLVATSEDDYFIHKNINAFEFTCASKINSTLNLDEVLINEPLDFFVLFSSIASVLGNRGQTDYSAANAWLDKFALDRNQYVLKNLRRGITVSISWPFIAGGGFQLDNSYLDWMKEHWGMMPMNGTQVLTGISTALANQTAHVLPFIGNQEQLIAYYNKTCLPLDTRMAENSSSPVSHQQHTIQLVKDIKEIIATHQKIKIDDLNIETDLTAYGYSSISFTELSTLINEKFAISTTPAIFFDATCIKELCELLIEDYPDVFMANIENVLDIDQRDASDEMDEAVLSTRFDDPIAIIGYHARLPGAESADEYWDNLQSGIHSISEIPAMRWRWQDVYGDPQEGDFTRSKWGGFISDIDKFDARFFGISPREAELMDPQQRIFLQSVYHAMEHSGYSKQSFSEQKTGLYVGVSLFEYGKLLQQYADIDAYTSSGTVHSIVANRVSYHLGLTGPSIALDTACSSSLVAIHEAVKALRYGDCELAIAGGVNALLEPSFYIAFDKAGMLSPDGKCKTFDKSANGYVRGEGVATLILKPLSKALRDNDAIYGLIRGSGVNHGGHAQTMTAPNPNAQAELIKDTFQKAKIPFNTVQYIECHGTGTPLGDPVEINGLKKAYQGLKQHNIELQEGVKCGIGSVKTNIGHLESSAGIAGVLKILLMMRNNQLVKTLNFSQLNPYIDLSNTPFYVVEENQVWHENKTRDGQIIPIRAAVSGFGFGGANAHVILEMPPKLDKTMRNAKPFYLITLSAVMEDSLEKKVHELVNWLQKRDNSHHDAIEAISFTLNRGREHFKYRLACVVSSQQSLSTMLSNYLENRSSTHVITGDSSLALQDKLIPTDVYHQLLTYCSADNAYKDLLLGIAQAYVQGEKIDWGMLHQGESNSRMELPLYPFEKKTYWFTKKINCLTSVPSENQFDAKLHNYCYTAQWEKFSFHEFATEPNHNHLSLAVYFDKQVQEAFQSSFSANVEQFVLVDEVRREPNRCYEIDRADVFSYIDALSSIEKMDVIYFICPKKTLEDDLSQDYLTSFYRFIKSMLQTNYAQRRITIKIITFGITDPFGEDYQLSAGAGIQGFAKTLANEFLEWQVDQFDFSIDTKILPPEVHYSLNASGSLSLYRNGTWLRQRLVPKTFSKTVQQSVFKNRGTYLIIGGLGGIGKVLSAYLATHYNANVIIVGRRPLDDLDEKYKHHYVQCDITQEQSVIALYETLQKTYQKIDGIFHCAMVLKDQSIRQMSENNLNVAIKPKGLGTFHLLNIMGGFVEDFIAVFSSTESYFALAGQSNYTAASWLQDQVAEAFYREQKKIKLIHWGLWEEAGAVSDERYQQSLHQLGFVGIKNNEALKLLELALLDTSFDVTLLGINHHAKAIYPILNEQSSKPGPLLILNEQAVHLLWAMMNDRDFWIDSEQVVSHQQLLNLTDSSKLSSSMVSACLNLLEENQFISYRESSKGYVSMGKNILRLEQVLEQTKQRIHQYPELKSFLEAMILSTTHLFELLKGAKGVTELMCPNGDLSLLGRFYSNNPIVNPINQLASNKVEEVVRAKLANENSVRIIEIGGGCGGTTTAVLELLRDKSRHIEYVFTDISSAFIARAKELFAHHSNIAFKQLDIETLGGMDGSYDVLIASNVLHATKNIRHTINNCKRLLNKNGVVIINEVTKKQDFLTVIFGMFSGWWAFQDTYRVPHSPLISVENWKYLLDEVGFDDINIVSAQSGDPHTLIYAVVSEKNSHSLPKGGATTELANSNKHEKLIEILSNVLKFSPGEISPLTSFADLGLDSITGVSFISKINREFDINLPVSIIFSHKNIVELAGKIREKEMSKIVSDDQLSPVFLFEE